MQPVPMDEDEAELRLEASISGLAERVPQVSARTLLSQGQRNLLIGILAALVIGLVLDVRVTLIVVIALATLAYLVAVFYRAYLFKRSMEEDAVEVVTDEEALSVPESELPFYTVLIPAYKEPSVILDLIENLATLDYPVDRLEILLLIEEDDHETLDVLRDADHRRRSDWSSYRRRSLGRNPRH